MKRKLLTILAMSLVSFGSFAETSCKNYIDALDSGDSKILAQSYVDGLNYLGVLDWKKYNNVFLKEFSDKERVNVMTLVYIECRQDLTQPLYKVIKEYQPIIEKTKIPEQKPITEKNNASEKSKND